MHWSSAKPNRCYDDNPRLALFIDSLANRVSKALLFALLACESLLPTLVWPIDLGPSSLMLLWKPSDGNRPGPQRNLRIM